MAGLQSRARAQEVVWSRADWKADAACRGLSALFIPPREAESPDVRHARETAAKELCASCSVIVACREYAARLNEPLGVWGGMTEAERRPQ